MRHRNSSGNFLLIWEHPSHYKSITASYGKTKNPQNLRRKIISQILSRGDYSTFLMHCFLASHQVSSLLQVSAKCTNAYDAGALNGFWLTMTWWRYSNFHCSVFTTSFLRKPTPWCDWNQAISLDFEKYVAQGVIGDLSAVALYTSGANWKMKSGIPSLGHLESKTVRSASIMRMGTLCWYLLVQRRDLVQG